MGNGEPTIHTFIFNEPTLHVCSFLKKKKLLFCHIITDFFFFNVS